VRAAIVAAATLAIATTAHAEDDDKPEIQPMRFVESGDDLRVTALPGRGIGKLFDGAGYEALGSGIPSTVVIRIQITPEDSDTPVAEKLIKRSVSYNVWNEVYELHVDGTNQKKDPTVRLRADALKWLTAIDDLPVARLAVLPVDKVFVLKMVAELNPVSKETLAEVRRWLSQGNGGGLDRGGAFFGSFVSVFYNPKIADADRVLRIQSRPFYRPPP
jgi:hypothetical protein